jgi:predicted secreted hydrolase
MKRSVVNTALMLVLASGFSSAFFSSVGAQNPDSSLERLYRRAEPGFAFAFPRDHGAHPDYKLEWWYYTGQLQAEDGRAFGYELTFFRIGMDRGSENPSVWAVDDLHVAHFAVSDLAAGSFSYWERINRQGPGIAWAREETLDVRNGSWTAQLDGDSMKLRAYADGVLMELRLDPQKPPVIHGLNGLSRKGDGSGEASHYYSMTRMATSGLLAFDGEAVNVRGESWMDHEFGTNQLSEDQIGWDWFSLQLDSGEEVMLYRLRRRDGAPDGNSSGTLVAGDGQGTNLGADDFSVRSLRAWTSPATGAVYPVEWELEIPSIGARLRVTPMMDDQELVTTRSTGIAYWEGAVRVEGTRDGEALTGRGYVELTGYREEDRPGV